MLLYIIVERITGDPWAWGQGTFSRRQKHWNVLLPCNGMRSPHMSHLLSMHVKWMLMFLDVPTCLLYLYLSCAGSKSTHIWAGAHDWADDEGNGKCRLFWRAFVNLCMSRLLMAFTSLFLQGDSCEIESEDPWRSEGNGKFDEVSELIQVYCFALLAHWTYTFFWHYTIFRCWNF